MTYINKFRESINKSNHKDKNIVIQKYVTQIYDDLIDQITNLKSEIERICLKHDNEMKIYGDNVNISIKHNQEITTNDVKIKLAYNL